MNRRWPWAAAAGATAVLATEVRRRLCRRRRRLVLMPSGISRNAGITMRGAMRDAELRARSARYDLMGSPRPPAP